MKYSSTGYAYTHLPDWLLEQMLEPVEILLVVAVPEGLWQELLLQLPDVAVRADRVVEPGKVEPVVEVSKVVKPGKEEERGYFGQNGRKLRCRGKKRLQGAPMRMAILC